MPLLPAKCSKDSIGTLIVICLDQLNLDAVDDTLDLSNCGDSSLARLLIH